MFKKKKRIFYTLKNTHFLNIFEDLLSRGHLSKGTDQKDDQINIMIIGQTGSGKSYFTNGMLGCKNPNDCLAEVSRMVLPFLFTFPFPYFLLIFSDFFKLFF